MSHSVNVITDNFSQIETPAPMKGSKFWNKIADKYARSPIADEASYQRKIEITRTYLEPHMQVFEFGCGTGSTALAHAPDVSHILATDISSRMLEIAKAKAAAAKVSNVSFKQAGIEDISISDDSIDVVLGCSILHLVDDHDAAIDKVHRMLKPGGVFVSSTACLSDSHWFLKPILPTGHWLGLLPKVAFLTRKSLEASLTRAGFEIAHHWLPGPRKAVFIIARKPVDA